MGDSIEEEIGIIHAEVKIMAGGTFTKLKTEEDRVVFEKDKQEDRERLEKIKLERTWKWKIKSTNLATES